jgi:hypothetical protein
MSDPTLFFSPELAEIGLAACGAPDFAERLIAGLRGLADQSPPVLDPGAEAVALPSHSVAA